MVKLLGSLCIFGSGAWVWYIQVAARRREREILANLLAALRQMEEEVRLTRTPLPSLLARLGTGKAEPTERFFQQASKALKAGLPLSLAWGQALSSLPVETRDRAALEELGQSLRGDEETVRKALALAIQRLETSLAELERQRPEAEKRTTALCFSGAALLVILLI